MLLSIFKNRLLFVAVFAIYFENLSFLHPLVPFLVPRGIMNEISEQIYRMHFPRISKHRQNHTRNRKKWANPVKDQYVLFFSLVGNWIPDGLMSLGGVNLHNFGIIENPNVITQNELVDRKLGKEWWRLHFTRAGFCRHCVSSLSITDLTVLSSLVHSHSRALFRLVEKYLSMTQKLQELWISIFYAFSKSKGK